MNDIKINLPSEFPLPPGASVDKFSVKHDTAANKLTVSATVLLQSVYELHNPVDDAMAKTPGGKKYVVGLAVPKTATALLQALKANSDALMVADGQKGPYPNCIKDGATKDGSNLFVKAGGAWQDWGYWSVKSKRCPVITRKESDQVIEVPAAEAIAGTWAIVLFDIIAIGYGDKGGNKRGTSAWMSRIHLLGGGKPIQGGGRTDDTDFMAMVEAAGSGATATAAPAATALF